MSHYGTLRKVSRYPPRACCATSPRYLRPLRRPAKSARKGRGKPARSNAARTTQIVGNAPKNACRRGSSIPHLQCAESRSRVIKQQGRLLCRPAFVNPPENQFGVRDGGRNGALPRRAGLAPIFCCGFTFSGSALPLSLSFRAARIAAANRTAYFRCSSI